MKIRMADVLPMLAVVLVLVIAAYAQWLIVGLPDLSRYQHVIAGTSGGAHGFPAWLRVTHFVNLLFMILLARSGLQILMDHPRLYWNVHCTPGSEWLRFSPVKVPTDRLYTAKDDARFLSPVIGLPGGRHTLGLARHWHFVSVLFWVTNGVIFLGLLFMTGQWRRLVPVSWAVVPGAWGYFVHYVTLHMPPEPDGFYAYNPLQQLAYFSVVFILAPLSIITGPAMSPALVNRFGWYRRLPGNRQIARSLHFLALIGYIVFVIAHVAMVVITGFARNMNHIVLGTDDYGRLGLWLGVAGLVGLVLLNAFANWLSHHRPRDVQAVGAALVNPALELLLARHAPRAEYTPRDISPFFWPNGKLPTSKSYEALAAGNFRDYRLRVYGLVENEVELSLEQILAMPRRSQITLHNCIQGWSGIAQWGGVSLRELFALVRPKPNAHVGVFYSFGEGGEGGEYYDSHRMEDLMHPQAILAYEMNFAPLNLVHGAPLRLRVENQLGFKMVKWIRAIELVEDYKHIFAGQGGYNEDNEFYDSMADI